MKTVKTHVACNGVTLVPGEPITEEQEAMIGDYHVVEIDGPADAGTVETGDQSGDEDQVPYDASWYVGDTIETVIKSVGDDPERAEFAVAAEQVREKPRAGVFEALGDPS